MGDKIRLLELELDIKRKVFLYSNQLMVFLLICIMNVYITTLIQIFSSKEADKYKELYHAEQEHCLNVESELKECMVNGQCVSFISKYIRDLPLGILHCRPV